MKITKDMQRKFLMDGAMAIMSVSSSEKERHKLLGSTDRKSYTVETRVSFLDEELFTYIEITPWEPHAKNVIEAVEKRAKYEMAKRLFDEGKLTPPTTEELLELEKAV